jgi:hypothetical protein
VPLLFSYGSNHPAQLSERLGHPVVPSAAYLPGWGRVFRGHSRRWGGAVATLERDATRTAFGLVIPVSPADLAVMDVAEGVALGLYRRAKITVRVLTEDRREEDRQAVVYLRARPPSEDPLGAPTTAYREAVARTIGTFWNNPDGSPVRASDIGPSPSRSRRR